jgi:hypothetical protein
MLNQTHQEGFVTKKQWTYNDDRFFRMAVYRDPDRQRKQAADPGPDRVDAPDYITVCIPAGLRLPGEIKAGQRLQVDGWLESRHFEVSLDEFLERARGPKVSVVVDEEMAQRVMVERTTTWIVADRVVIVPPGDRRPRRGHRSQ